MPLLLLCLPACFHRDVPADMSELQKSDFVSGGKARYSVCRAGERVPESDNREGREVGSYVAVYPDAHPFEGV